jgi:hypothetical protein
MQFGERRKNMAKNKGGSSAYVGNGTAPINAPNIKGSGTTSVKIIKPTSKG